MKVRARADGSAYFLQLSLQGRAGAAGGRRARLARNARAVPASPPCAIQRVRPPGRRLLRQLPHVRRRGDDRVLARGLRRLQVDGRVGHRRDGGRGDPSLSRFRPLRRRPRPQLVGEDARKQLGRHAVQAGAGRRRCAARRGRAAPGVRRRHELREAPHAGARACRASSATWPRSPNRSRDDPPPDRRSDGRCPPGPRVAARSAVGLQRRPSARCVPEARRRRDPLRRRPRGRQRDHQRPQGARHPHTRIDRRRAHRHVDLRGGGCS